LFHSVNVLLMTACLLYGYEYDEGIIMTSLNSQLHSRSDRMINTPERPFKCIDAQLATVMR
jgi:hypothetical protein